MIAHRAPVGRVPSHGAAPPGRRKAIGHRSSTIVAAAKPPSALGHNPQDTSSPEETKEGGELPEGWRWVTLGDVAESMKNGIYKPASFYAEDGLACLRMYNIGEGRIVWRDIKRMRLSEEEICEYELLPGDLLVNRVNSRELVGKAVAIPSGLERCVFESKNIRVRIRRDLASPEFVSYRLLCAGSRYFTQNAQQVVGMASISQPQVARFPLPLPPLPDQRRIVAEIEKQFTRLEAGVAALRRVQANLKRYRAAVLKAACEGKLVPTEAELARVGRVSPRGVRPNAKNAASGDAAFNAAPYETGEQLLQRILAERRENWTGCGKYKEPAAPDTANLPPLSNGWTWVTVEQLSTRVVDGTHHTPDYIADGIAFISVKDIRGGIIHFDDCKFISPEAHADLSKRCEVQRGDVLITKSGTIGRMAVVNTDRPFSLFVSVALIKPVRGIFDPKFLELSLEGYIGSINISQDVKGALLKNLHLEDLRVVPLRLPPLAEQTRIVAEVERRLSVVEELETVVGANLQRATRLRQSILQKAFTGKLTTTQ
jgi:type I restriction enzyme S subunit